MGMGGGQKSQETESGKAVAANMRRGMDIYGLNEGQTPKLRPTYDVNDPFQKSQGEQRVVGFNKGQENAFRKALDAVGEDNWKPGLDKAQGYVDQGVDATLAGTRMGDLGTGWSIGDNGNHQYWGFDEGVQNLMNPYTSAVLDDGLDEMLYRGAIGRQQLGMDAANASAFGGDRHAIVEGNFNRDLMQEMSRYTNQVLSDAFNASTQQYNTLQNAGQAQQGINQANTQIANNALNNASTQTMAITEALQAMREKEADTHKTVYDAYQAQEQMRRDAGYNAAIDDYYQIMQNIEAINGTAGSSSVSRASGGGGSPIAGIIGSILPMLFGSDERLKFDIEDADASEALEDIKKLTPKTYRYKESYGHRDGTKKRRGFMAQDAEKTRGIKVVDVGGIKHIDSQSAIETAVHAIHALDAKIDKLAKDKR